MNDPGYVYALINPSLEGMVKIGKTTKEPQGRAKELSSATGVPTPFIVAYEVFVKNCSEAESYVHTLLEQKGYRVAQNKEFFNVPLKEVVEVMNIAHESIGELAKENEYVIANINQESDEFLDNLTLDESYDDSTYHIIQQAEEYYYGLGDCLQDHNEAFKLFNQAAKLGSPKAYNILGKMLCNGEGCVKNIKRSLDCFKEGARKGYSESYAEMGALFCWEDHAENSRKCWKKFFESELFDTKNDVVPFEENIENVHYKKSYHACSYLQLVFFGKLPLENKETLLCIKNAIIQMHENAISFFKKNNDTEAISRRTQELDFANNVLN